MTQREIVATYEGADRFEVAVGPHRVTVDQPVDAGGDDAGPTPTELFVASLASCMGFFAQRFLRRNGVDPAGLELRARITTAERPHRVGAIVVEVTLPPIEDPRADALRRAVERCTVHHSLRMPPEVEVSILESFANVPTRPPARP